MYAASGEGDVDLDFTKFPERVTGSSAEGNVIVDLPRGPETYQVRASSGEGSVTNGVAEDSLSPRVVIATSSEGDVSVSYSRG